MVSDFVNIAVDPSVRPDWDLKIHPASVLSIFSRPKWIWQQIIKSVDITIYNLATERARHADAVVVRPELAGLTFLDYGRGKQAIHAGAQAMTSILPDLYRMRAAARFTAL
jgi:hypothetical protein